MKRILVVLIALNYFFLPYILKGGNSRADEGMWTLYNLPDAVYKQMRAEGFMLPKEALYNDLTNYSLHSEHAIIPTLSSAVVNFSGFCTGEVVSPKGLVLTNHHCGFEAIRSHSTVEHDYMKDGFYAESYEQELPNENMFVAFMKKQENVTEKLRQLGLDSLDFYNKEALIDSLEEAMSCEVKKIDSTYYVEINAFFEGNAYYATTYQRYPDVRLVFAPPKSMGKFGGETDNWMWPRQTCDVSVFRIYVDPLTGGPAEYSPKNVPMLPDNWLWVSTNGYKEGDFAMVMGYPGSTSRYLSSYGIEEMRNCINDPRQQVRGVKQEVMKKHMDASEAVRIKYDSKYAQSANYWKNAIGMNKCIDSIGVVRQKRAMEAKLTSWDSTTLKNLYAKRAEAMRANTFFSESFSYRSGNELAVRATKFYSGMPVLGDSTKVKKQYLQFKDNSDQWDRDLDIETMAVMIENYRSHVPEKYIPSFYKRIDKEFHGDYRAYVEAIWNNSVLMKKNAKIPLRMTRKLQKDLGIDFSMSLVETLADLKIVLDDIRDSIREEEKILCAEKLRAEENLPHYSDANFTLRMTYGQVGGYVLNGGDSGYYTTAKSMREKMQKGGEIRDYYVEPRVRQLFDADVYGILDDKVSNTLNMCFLTNNDITGGNSGSPVLDSHGHLIGLAFDGNWDSLSSDIFFDTSLARCINVDIRYVLYMMKAWGNATRLLQEMGIE